ncbi:hypothetical protein AYK24_04065 [Thermoplasmatales archaeon SG8-52-4]|nr:MAG: hypothetical protein AYK24_04065 [Thermoplasmatales archaeon SG8-52-4]
MRKIKLFLEAAVVITVVLALILPSSAVVTNNVNNYGLKQDSVANAVKVFPINVESRGTDVLMPSSPGNDRLPSITKDDAGHSVVTWTNEEDVSTWNMGIAYSDDPTDPMSWAGWIVTLLETTMVWYSDTAYVDGPEPDDFHGLYGANLYYDTDMVGGYEILDITTDPSTWTYYYWDSPAIDQVCRVVEDGGYYDEPYYGHEGALSMAIYHFTELGYDIVGCPQYRNQDMSEGGSTTYFFDAQANLQTAPARDCDYATLPDWFHLTWEYHNTTEDVDKIVWKKIDPAVEADIEFTPYQDYVAYGTNPSIEAFEDGGSYYVAIVYANEGNIECVYSDDDGETWAGPVIVAPGSFPALRAIGTTLYCAYVDGGNLYLKTSENGGSSWSSAEQINDIAGSVVAEVNSVDIHVGGIVWVDGRGDDLDIYWDSFDIGSAPDAPTITGPNGGKPEKSYDFTFSAVDPDGDDVRYIIDWGDGNFETTDYNPSGDDKTVSHTWAEEGSYTITAKAEDIYGLTSPETTKIVNMPRNKAVNHPWFLRILINHPNLFPVLRQLLGL